MGSVEDASQMSDWAALAGQFATYRQRLADRATQHGGPDAAGLTEAERKMVLELQARDREVRAHEQAHAAVGGQYAGRPSYTYRAGPDGQRYAVAGEVPIDVAPVQGDPEATVQKMEVVKAAALAPAEPSAQDRKVAALAEAKRAVAMTEVMALREAERNGVALDNRV